ncbi:hypothetical protein Hamer_G008113 [Homarus americanus]|uniref:Uncharacterized protein n=1 Tax=Homarus americanus TaxID=6706 RepID=A0A8J5K002_HOMAM|nr:hypothetical protein Hamer_G008113 [Homarus americanus]
MMQYLKEACGGGGVWWRRRVVEAACGGGGVWWRRRVVEEACGRGVWRRRSVVEEALEEEALNPRPDRCAILPIQISSQQPPFRSSSSRVLVPLADAHNLTPTVYPQTDVQGPFPSPATQQPGSWHTSSDVVIKMAPERVAGPAGCDVTRAAMPAPD